MNRLELESKFPTINKSKEIEIIKEQLLLEKEEKLNYKEQLLLEKEKLLLQKEQSLEV